MSLKDYFESNRGIGVLSTADRDGRVDSAIYSRPRLIENATVAWIMRDRLSHSNLQSDPHASFLFKEDGDGYNGKRLFPTKVGEEQTPNAFNPCGAENQLTTMERTGFWSSSKLIGNCAWLVVEIN